MKKDILKLVAYFKVYGLDLYGVKHCGLDTGKGNLESYFCNQLQWSESKLKRLVSILRADYILKKQTAEVGLTLLSLSTLHKTQLKYLEI